MPKVVEFVGDLPTIADRRRWRVLDEVYGSTRLGERRDTWAEANVRLRRAGLPEFLTEAEMAAAWHDCQLDRRTKQLQRERRPEPVQGPSQWETLAAPPDPERERRMPLYERALASTLDDGRLLDNYNRILTAAGLQPVRPEAFRMEVYWHDQYIKREQAEAAKLQEARLDADLKAGRVREFVADVEAV